MDHGDAWRDIAKILGGGLGAFVGSVLVKLGWRKAKQEREGPRVPRDQQPRLIEEGEWERLRDLVQGALRSISELEKDLVRVEGKTDRDHDRLSSALVELSLLRQELNAVSDHCDHCPGHGGGRR